VLYTTKRTATIAAVGFALLAMPFGHTASANAVRTRPEIPFNCNGSQVIRGLYNNPGGSNGTWGGTVNACDSGEYFNTRIVYTPPNDVGEGWAACDFEEQTMQGSCTPGGGSTSYTPCTSPCYSPGQIYVQNEMDGEVQTGGGKDGSALHPPYYW